MILVFFKLVCHGYYHLCNLINAKSWYFCETTEISQGLRQTLLLGTVRGTNFLPVFFNEKTVSRLIDRLPRFYILPIVGCHSLFWVKETWGFFQTCRFCYTPDMISYVITHYHEICLLYCWYPSSDSQPQPSPSPPPKKKSNYRSSFPKHTWTSYTCILLKTNWSLSHLGIYIEKYFNR